MSTEEVQSLSALLRDWYRQEASTADEATRTEIAHVLWSVDGELAARDMERV